MKWNDDSYNDYMGLSAGEREAIQAFFDGTPEQALGRVQRQELPPGLTRNALHAYDALAVSAIKSGKDLARTLTVYGRVIGVQAFRRELITAALNFCAR